LCTVEVAGTVCGLPVDRVQEVVRHERVTPVPMAPPGVRGLINLRGRIVTAVDLRQRLGLPDSSDDASMHVILRDDDGAISLLVDRVGDVVTVSESDWEDPPATLRGVARRRLKGAYKQRDGLLLVLDLDDVLDVGEERP
jgi:purine-binding chemotaxis protein CheW